MKKITALFLVLVICASLCACGGKAAAPQEETAQPAKSLDTLTPPKKAEPVENEAPKKAEVTVTDLCNLSGRCFDGYGWTAVYSYMLPDISGPDTSYLRQIRSDIDGIYEEYVAPQLTSMQAGDGFLYDTCSYSSAENNGIHSFAICVTTDWEQNIYWCYNFDEDGNEVGNGRILKEAGYSAEEFVSRLQDYLEDYLDYSDFMEPDEWELCQEMIVTPTLAEDNCNAEIPMYLNTDGNLCCIMRIYSIAGAESYLRELELQKDGTFTEHVDNGSFLSRLTGGYLFPAADDEYSEYFCRIFTIADNLVMELCYRDSESGSVFSYSAAEMIPEDRADLYRTDIDSMRFTFNVYSVSAFGGSYSGESSVYTVRLTDDGISLTDFEGKCPLFGTGEDLEGTFDWSDDDYASQYFDWDMIDYSLIDEAGISGVWSGYYVDNNYGTHSILMELTDFGSIKMRDVAGTGIPTVLEGYYYVVGSEDGAYPEGSVAYTLTRTGDYKMPLFGCCGMEIDEEGSLLIWDLMNSADDFVFVPQSEYGCAVLERVQAFTQVREKMVLPLGEDPVSVDIDMDGVEENITFFCDLDSDDIIDTIHVTLNDDDYYTSCWMYDAEAWLVIPDLSGTCYVVVDGLTDNDYHFLTVLGVFPDRVVYSGEWSGGFRGTPEDPDCFTIEEYTYVLGTLGVSRTYATGTGGLPEAIAPFFYVSGEPKLTLKRELEFWEVDPETGNLLDFCVLMTGTVLKPYRTDGETMIDVKTADGRCFRMWLSQGDFGREIDGVPVDDLFDGIIYAG